MHLRKGGFKGYYSTSSFLGVVPMACIFFGSTPLFKSVPVDLCTYASSCLTCWNNMFISTNLENSFHNLLVC